MHKVKISMRADKLMALESILVNFPGINAMLVHEDGFMVGNLYYNEVPELLTAIHEAGMHYINLSFSGENED